MKQNCRGIFQLLKLVCGYSRNVNHLKIPQRVTSAATRIDKKKNCIAALINILIVYCIRVLKFGIRYLKMCNDQILLDFLQSMSVINLRNIVTFLTNDIYRDYPQIPN